MPSPVPLFRYELGLVSHHCEGRVHPLLGAVAERPIVPIDEVLELGIAGREEALRYYRGVGLSRVLVEQIENPIVSIALELVGSHPF